MVKTSEVRAVGNPGDLISADSNRTLSFNSDTFRTENFGIRSADPANQLKRVLSLAASAIDKILVGKSAEFRNEVIYLLASEKAGSQSVKILLDRFELVRGLLKNINSENEEAFLGFLKSLNNKKEINNAELKIISHLAVHVLKNSSGKELSKNLLKISDLLNSGALDNINQQDQLAVQSSPRLAQVIRQPLASRNISKALNELPGLAFRPTIVSKEDSGELKTIPAEQEKEKFEIKQSEDLEALQKLILRFLALLEAGSEILKKAVSEKSEFKSSSRKSEALGAYEAWQAVIDVVAMQLSASKIGSVVVSVTGLTKLKGEFREIFGKRSENVKREAVNN